MTVAHTQTPWQVYNEHGPMFEQLCTVIANLDGEYHDGGVQHTYDFVCTTLNENQDNPERCAVANANFIVRACNTHDDLVAALHQYRSDMLHQPSPDSAGRRVEMIDRLLSKARGEG
jgi:hypothetical protein